MQLSINWKPRLLALKNNARNVCLANVDPRCLITAVMAKNSMWYNTNSSWCWKTWCWISVETFMMRYEIPSPLPSKHPQKPWFSRGLKSHLWGHTMRDRIHKASPILPEINHEDRSSQSSHPQCSMREMVWMARMLSFVGIHSKIWGGWDWNEGLSQQCNLLQKNAFKSVSLGCPRDPHKGAKAVFFPT